MSGLDTKTKFRENNNALLKECQALKEENLILKKDNDYLKKEMKKVSNDLETLNKYHSEKTQNFTSSWQRPTVFLDSLNMDNLVKLNENCCANLNKAKQQQKEFCLFIENLSKQLVEHGTPQEKVDEWKSEAEEIFKMAILKVNITSLQVEHRLTQQVFQYDCPRILENLEEIDCTISSYLT